MRLTSQGVALIRLGSGSLTGGRVHPRSGTACIYFAFSFFWSGVLVSKAGIRFLVVVLSCPRLLCYGLAIVAPLFVLLGPGGLPYAS